jgi:hypothetical protein
MGRTDGFMDGWAETDPLIIGLAILATIVALVWHYRTQQPYHARPRPMVPRPPSVRVLSLPAPKVDGEVIIGLVPRCTACGSSDVTVITPLSNYAGDPWSLADCGPCRSRVYAHAS